MRGLREDDLRGRRLADVAKRFGDKVVLDGVNGLSIPCNDLDALCAAMEKLYRHPELLGPMRVAARARALEHFSWESYRARMLAGYRRAVQLAAGPA